MSVPEVPGGLDGLLAWVASTWEREVLPALGDYTRVRCLSPAFDPGWRESGELHRAARLLESWSGTRPVAGLRPQVLEIGGRTPVLLVEAPGSRPGSVLVYGHLDKQPPQGQWRSGLGPYEPVREDERLYGRGTADDGYALFAALVALEALDSRGLPRPDVRVLVEASEESGSPDLDAYLDQLAPRLGQPDLVVCLDSGCLTYDRLWRTTSLRGNLVATLRVDVLDEGVHSGLAGGVVPSSFRLLRRLLSRIEDERTGAILLPELQVAVPEVHRASLSAIAEEFGHDAAGGLPTVPGLRLAGSSAADRLVARAWAPALAVTGMDGIPAVRDGGNVLRPFTAARISLRLAPTCDAAAAAEALRRTLEADPPDGARVAVSVDTPASGWLAPDPEPWLDAALSAASEAAFGRPPSAYGEGGTIPFLATLGARFPGTQLVATGVLGPHSNAHGPNEFLHLPMAHGVTTALAHLIEAAGRASPLPSPSPSPSG
ncbi:MAG TPA: M20/M25/M40 family metallo-hydrolase [Acidimicrobiales bacterium]|jgi:acetylornithine deacetylase/succinyl-diaminopimelate desuccinylase-like protein